MSGTIAKTLSFLSFILAIGLVLAAPVSDAASSEDSPYSSISTDAYAVVSGGEDPIYIAVGGSVTIYGYVSDSETYSVTSVTDGFGLDLYLSDGVYSLAGTVSAAGSIDVTITIADPYSGQPSTYEFVLEAVEVSEADSSNTYEETTDGNTVDTDAVDSAATEEEGYSYWLAVIIIALVVVAIIWLVKKVKG